MKIAVISSEFSEKAGKALQVLRESCFEKLKALNVGFSEFRVPGAFEIPTVAKKALEIGKFDAVITLGIVVRGETPHFDFVAGNCARKIADLGVEFAKPVIFGVLTVDTTEQAEARAERGKEFAEAAVKMVEVLGEIK